MLALASTWPLARELDTSLTRGTDVSATVPFVSAWSLWWTADRAAAGFQNLWDAPIFFPTRQAYAFSEPMLLEGLLGAPLQWLGASPVLACNLVLLAALVSNGAFALALLRSLGLAPLAAVAGGAMLCLLPLVHHELGVLTLVPLAGVLASLHALLAFSRRPSPLLGLRLGIAFAAAYLLCGQYALFLGLVAGPAALCLASRAQLAPRSLIGAAVALATAAALILPVAIAQIEVRRTHGFARSARAVALGAAAPGDYLVTPAAPLFPFPGIQTAADPNRRALFPGALKLALALAGLAWGLRRAETRRFAGFLLATAAGAVALSLLPGWGGMRGTHAWLRDLVPGLSQIRSFWRASMLMQVATVLLAAMGIQALAEATRRLAPPRARRTAYALAIGIALAASAELWPLAPGLSPAPAREAWRPWLDWIDQHLPPGAALVHLPVPASEAVADYEETARAMLLATAHGRPLVNGYSSYFPSGYRAFARIMRGCPSPRPGRCCTRWGCACSASGPPGSPPIRVAGRTRPSIAARRCFPSWASRPGRRLALSRQVRAILGVRREPLREAPHRRFVLFVDEAIDRPLEPPPGGRHQVVSLLEVQARAARPERLEPDAARLIVARLAADHAIRVAARRLDLAHQLERRSAPAEGKPVAHPPQQAVAARVARPEHLDAEHHRGIVGPARVVLHQRPQPLGRMRKLDLVAVLAHADQ